MNHLKLVFLLLILSHNLCGQSMVWLYDDHNYVYDENDGKKIDYSQYSSIKKYGEARTVGSIVKSFHEDLGFGILTLSLGWVPDRRDEILILFEKSKDNKTIDDVYAYLRSLRDYTLVYHSIYLEQYEEEVNGLYAIIQGIEIVVGGRPIPLLEYMNR